jgi:DNA-binding NtrC family response regulator
MKIAVVAADEEVFEAARRTVCDAGHDLASDRSVVGVLRSAPALVFAHCPSAESLPMLIEGIHTAARLPQPIPVVVLIEPAASGLIQRLWVEGATDILLCPPDPEELRTEIEGICPGEQPFDAAEHAVFQELRQTLLVGESTSFRQCLTELRLAARSDGNLLLIGETGTGKEMFARAAHKLSRRASCDFLGVNCTALPHDLLENELFGHARGAFTGAQTSHDGRFASVGAGTLLLDEVGELPLALQVKLLRVIDQRAFQRLGDNRDIAFRARLIAATCKNLEEAVERGRFRRDLLGRLDQFRIILPPLRDREGDIAILANHFLQKHAPGRPIRLSALTRDALEAFGFPENIRQLENAVVRALAHSPAGRVLLPRHLPPEIRSPRAAGAAASHYTIRLPANLDYKGASEQAQQEVDRLYLSALLRKHRRNQTRAAQEAGIDRKTFAKKLGLLKSSAQADADD